MHLVFTINRTYVSFRASTYMGSDPATTDEQRIARVNELRNIIPHDSYEIIYAEGVEEIAGLK